MPTSCCVIVLPPPRLLADDLALDRAERRLDVDAVVLVEALVLDGDERLRDVPGSDSKRYARADLAADLADQRAVAREDERRLRQRMICQASPVRSGCGAAQCAAAEASDERIAAMRRT